MSRTKIFFYNTTIAAILQIIILIAGLIVPRIILTVYGSEINGLVSSILQFIAYFSLVEAGLSGASIYALYKPLANNDHKAINGVVSATKLFYKQVGYIFMLLVLGLAFIYPLIVKTEVLSVSYIRILVLVLGVSGLIEFFTLAKYRALLTADQKTYIISLATIIHIILNTIIIVVMANLNVNVVVLQLASLLSIFIRTFILMTYVKKKYKYINYKEASNTVDLNKRWDVMYFQITNVIHVGAPIAIITLLLKDLKMVSIFTIFNMVIAGLSGIFRIFNRGLSASFGNIIVKKEQKVLQKAYSEFEFMYYSIVTILYSVTLVTIMPFIRIYTAGITDANYDLPIIGFLFVVYGLTTNINSPQGMIVIAAGMYKETKLPNIIQGLIAIIGGIILGIFYGLAGVLLGSILSNIFRDIYLMFFIPRNVTKLPVKESFYRIVRIILCMLIIWIPYNFIEINPIGYLNWIFIATCVGICSTLVVTLNGLIFERKEMKNVVSRIKMMVGTHK